MIDELGTEFWDIAKIGVIALLLLYMVFAFVIVRQVQIMTKTLEVGFEFPIKLLSWVHLLFAAGTLLLAVVIL